MGMGRERERGGEGERENTRTREKMYLHVKCVLLQMIEFSDFQPPKPRTTVKDLLMLCVLKAGQYHYREVERRLCICVRQSAFDHVPTASTVSLQP